MGNFVNLNKIMNTLIKIFYIFVVLYIVLQAGRAWGQTEIRNQKVTPAVNYDKVNKYNEIMLINCLKKDD